MRMGTAKIRIPQSRISCFLAYCLCLFTANENFFLAIIGKFKPDLSPIPENNSKAMMGKCIRNKPSSLSSTELQKQKRSNDAV